MIDAHGRRDSIALSSGKIIFSVKDKNKLQKNENIKCLIILSCQSNGESKSNRENLATVLSKKINSSGVVVASKYDVASYDEKTVKNLKEGEKLHFESSHKSVSGWTVLRNGIAKTSVKIPAKITISKLINILINNELLK